MRFGLAVILALLTPVVAVLPARAQIDGAEAAAPSPSSLRNGRFAWYEQPEMIRASLGPRTPVSVVVSIPDQRAYVYRGGKLVGASTVSTGSDGRDTPPGDYTILEKKPFHRSNLYSNAPMPWMQRLTWDGIAMHAGHLPGYRASHGCIRFPAAFAKQLYELTAMGGSVSVVEVPVSDPEFDIYGPPAPTLVADTRDLGGQAFDVVTMSGPAPAEAPASQPASWVAGPAREIVQPIPAGAQ